MEQERKRNHKIMITIGITLDIKEDPSIPSLTLQSQPLATIQGKVKSTIKVNPIKVWSKKKWSLGHNLCLGLGFPKIKS